MKRTIAALLVAVLLTAPVLIAVKPVWASSSMWTQTYGNEDYDSATSLVETADGGYAILGTTSSTSYTLYGDFWLVKTDGEGHMLWNRTYGDTKKAHAYYLIQTSDGGYALVGYILSSPDNNDAWLVRTDADGYELWNQTYGGPENDIVYSIVQNSDGGYTIGGSLGSSSGSGDAWLVRTDADGYELWNQTYGGSGSDAGRALVQTNDGGYATLGVTTSFGAGGLDFWLVKTDANGTLEWTQAYGGPEDDLGMSLVQTIDGGYALTGITVSQGAGSFDAWLIKTDSAGYEVWNQTYGQAESDSATSLVQISDGGYAVAGSTSSYGAGNGDFWLVKTDADGNVVWNQTYGGTEGEGAFSLIKTSDGGYALVGFTSSFGVEDKDFLLVKTDEYGVVPEAAWIILPLLLAATSAIFISKKKLPHPQSQVS